MKAINLFVGLTLAAALAHAAIAPRNLADAMKIMNEKLKAINAQVNNAGMNPQSAILADEFVEANSAGKAFIPTTVSNLPQADQAVKIARYNALMDQSIEQGKKMAQAFRDNDNAAAAALLNELKSSRNTGHSEFRSP